MARPRTRPRGSRATLINFSPADRALIEQIKSRYGLMTMADAVRHGLRMALLVDRASITLDPAPGDAPGPARAAP